MKTRKGKLLTKLKIDEVSGVPEGAGVNCRVMLMKRNDPDDEREKRRRRKEAKKMKIQRQMRKFAKRVAKIERARAHNPEPFEKRAARVEDQMNAVIAELRKADPRLILKDRAVCIAKIATMREHAELWAEYREVERIGKLGGGSLPKGPGPNAPANQPGHWPIATERLPALPVVDSDAPTLEALVEAHLERRPAVTRAKAYSEVMATAAGREAYARERDGRLIAAAGLHRQVAVAGG